MGAKHVLRPKSHQRSLSNALNTSKPGDETVAFKFYGRCKQGLLTSTGWSAPWSDERLLVVSVVVVVVCVWRERAETSGAGTGRTLPTRPCPKCLCGSRVTFGDPPDLRGFSGSRPDAGRQTSTSRVSSFRGPQQGTAEAPRRSHLETDTLAEEGRRGHGLMTIPPE